jgi:hypothetical protein
MCDYVIADGDEVPTIDECERCHRVTYLAYGMCLGCNLVDCGDVEEGGPLDPKGAK